jgi:hypothetical protein
LSAALPRNFAKRFRGCDARDNSTGQHPKALRIGGLGLAKLRVFVHSVAMFFDNLPLEMTCSKCGKQINETVKWLKAESRKCPFCGTVIDTTEFRRGIDEATNRTHEMLRDLQESLKSVKIKIKL